VTHEQEEQVRRALRSLPPEGRLPAEVRDRLDATLADLVSERESAAMTAPATAVVGTDELAARRRRRWRAGLVAAAGVAVLGVGLGTLVDDLSSGGDAEQSTVAGDSASDAGGRVAAPEAAPERGTRRYRVSSGTLDVDVARIAALGPVQAARKGTTDSTGPQAGPDGAAGSLAGAARCAVPSTAPAHSNQVCSLNPATVSIVNCQSAGSEPNVLALSDDGQFLYVGEDGTGSVQRFKLPGLTPDISISLGSDPFDGPFYARSMEVAPGVPHTIAVSRGIKNLIPKEIGGIAIYDDSTQRLTIAPGWGGAGNAYSSLTWGADASALSCACAGVTESLGAAASTCWM